MATSYCPSCGSPLYADAPLRFCPGCGHAFCPPKHVRLRAVCQEKSEPEEPDIVIPPPAENAKKTTRHSKSSPNANQPGSDTKVEGEEGAGVQPHKFLLKPNYLRNFRLKEVIGKGGSAIVYKGIQKSLGREVAIKILKQVALGEGKFHERVFREIQTMAMLKHPNIVRLYDAAIDNEEVYLIYELIDGMTLRELVLKGPVKEEETARIVKQVCEALIYAHNRGIIHRDVKPENILLTSEGEVKLTDFGIARMLGDNKKRQPITLTMKNTSMGTAYYMAPEQRKSAHDIDERADVYALGVVLFELLTGEVPIGNLDYFFESSERINKDLQPLLKESLNPIKKNRPRTAEDFQRRLLAVVPVEGNIKITSATRNRFPIRRLLAGLLTAAGIGCLILAFLFKQADDARKNYIAILGNYLEIHDLYKTGEFVKTKTKLTAIKNSVKARPEALSKKHQDLLNGRLTYYEERIREKEEKRTDIKMLIGKKTTRKLPAAGKRRLGEALKYFEAGDKYRAKDIINTVVEKYPYSKEAKELQNKIYAAFRVKEIESEIRNILDDTKTFYQLRNYPKAMASITKAIQLSPNHQAAAELLRKIETDYFNTIRRKLSGRKRFADTRLPAIFEDYATLMRYATPQARKNGKNMIEPLLVNKCVAAVETIMKQGGAAKGRGQINAYLRIARQLKGQDPKVKQLTSRLNLQNQVNRFLHKIKRFQKNSQKAKKGKNHERAIKKNYAQLGRLLKNSLLEKNDRQKLMAWKKTLKKMAEKVDLEL